MSARRLLVVVFLVVIGVGLGYGQGCYVPLDDASGHTPTSPELASLEAAACELQQAFPQEYQDSFVVYDFGFYLHQEQYEGGFPQVFADKLAEVEQLSPYFLLFGRQTDQSGVNSRMWMGMKLPDTGAFECHEDDFYSMVEFRVPNGNNSSTEERCGSAGVYRC